LHPKNIHWTTPKQEDDKNTSSCAADADATVQDHICQVQQCAVQFTWIYIERPSDSDWWSTLLCDVSVTTELLHSVVQKHNNILFVGDSVLRQQFMLLLCMIDPMLDCTQVTDNEGVGRKASYDYWHPDGSITSLFYEAFGHRWTDA